MTGSEPHLGSRDESDVTDQGSGRSTTRPADGGRAGPGPARSRELPWVRITVEAFAIVASILVAFALEAWWAERLERTEEQQVLRSLQEEFTQTARGLEGGTNAHRAVERAAAAVAESLAEGAERVDVPDTLLAMTLVVPLSNPPQGALGAILSSGRLGIIRDRELREALAAWPAQLEGAVEDEAVTRLISFQLLRPQFVGSVDDARFVYDRFRGIPSAGSTSVRVTPELRNHLLLRATDSRVIAGRLERTRDRARQLLTLIEGQLN